MLFFHQTTNGASSVMSCFEEMREYTAIITGINTGGIINFQASYNNIDWVTAPFMVTTGGPTVFNFKIATKYLRAILTNANSLTNISVWIVS